MKNFKNTYLMTVLLGLASCQSADNPNLNKDDLSLLYQMTIDGCAPVPSSCPGIDAETFKQNLIEIMKTDKLVVLDERSGTPTGEPDSYIDTYVNPEQLPLKSHKAEIFHGALINAKGDTTLHLYFRTNDLVFTDNFKQQTGMSQRSVANFEADILSKRKKYTFLRNTHITEIDGKPDIRCQAQLSCQ